MNDDAIKAARFGIEVEQFLASEVGRYLIARAKDEETQALEALAEAPAQEWKRIIELQQTVKRARSIETWLAVAVQNGRAAIRDIEARESLD